MSVLALILIALPKECKAQRLAVSTNAVYWGILSPNMNVEFALGRHSTISMEAAAAPWNINNRYSISHITVTPDYKYWFTMPFFGHFTGANLLYSSYRRIKDSQEKTGNIVALGATYGYAFIINRRFNIVPTIGLGAGVDFSEDKCRIVPVPTRIGVNFQFVIK